MRKIQKSDFENLFQKVGGCFSNMSRRSKKPVSSMGIEGFSSRMPEKNHFYLCKNRPVAYTSLELPNFDYNLNLNFECNYEPIGGVLVYDRMLVGTVLYNVDETNAKYGNKVLEKQYKVFNALIKNKPNNIYVNRDFDKVFLINALRKKRNLLITEILNLIPRNEREFEERCEKYDLIESELKIIEKIFHYVEEGHDESHMMKILFRDYKSGKELNELQEWVLENCGGVNVYTALVKNAVLHIINPEENEAYIDSKLKNVFKQNPGEEVAFITEEQKVYEASKSRKKQTPAVIFEYALKV